MKQEAYAGISSLPNNKPLTCLNPAESPPIKMIRHITVIGKEPHARSPESLPDSSPAEEVHICDTGPHDHGFFEKIRIRSGLKMIVANHAGRHDIQMGFEIGRAPVSLSYNLSQCIHCTMVFGASDTRRIKRSPGDCVIAYLPQTRGTIEMVSDNRIVGVSLHFSVRTFTELFSEVPPGFQNLGWCLEKTSLARRFYRQSPIGMETALILKQILECPYEGEIRRLFFEAKSLELVALKFFELEKESARRESNLNRRDLDRAREAHHILMTRLDHPPNLVDLSRMVGTNRNKLNSGFKQLYGHTVFNVLRNARLAKALSLLRETDWRLSEIALSVGYSNQANFATAFRKRFGKSPMAVRREMIGCVNSRHAISCWSNAG